jgi:Zn-dependent peptidase ImmA (M78 family)
MPKLYHSKAWLERQRKTGKTIAEIAAVCGVSYQMIDKKLKEFGIK